MFKFEKDWDSSPVTFLLSTRNVSKFSIKISTQKINFGNVKNVLFHLIKISKEKSSFCRNETMSRKGQTNFENYFHKTFFKIK